MSFALALAVGVVPPDVVARPEIVKDHEEKVLKQFITIRHLTFFESPSFEMQKVRGQTCQTTCLKPRDGSCKCLHAYKCTWYSYILNMY